MSLEIKLGIINKREGISKGVQVGISNRIEDSVGLEVGLDNRAEESKGVQAGISNFAGGSKGVQAGISNFAIYQTGFQIGFVNTVCRSIGKGTFQIGAVNLGLDSLLGIQVGLICYTASYEKRSVLQFGLLTIRKTVDLEDKAKYKVSPFFGCLKNKKDNKKFKSNTEK